jgi:hypothetical protein
LDGNYLWWFDDLCDLWADTMDPTQDAQVYLVQPAPPTDPLAHPQHHLLLVQGQGDGIPVLLTALFEHETNRRAWSFAAILPAFATAFEVFEVLGIQRWCDRRQCLLHIAGLEVPRNELTQLQHGDGIVVTILPQQLPIEPDDTSLMQTDRGDTISAVQAQRSTADALDFADATSPILPGLTALPTPVHMRWHSTTRLSLNVRRKGLSCTSGHGTLIIKHFGIALSPRLFASVLLDMNGRRRFTNLGSPF